MKKHLNVISFFVNALKSNIKKKPYTVKIPDQNSIY